MGYTVKRLTSLRCQEVRGEIRRWGHLGGEVLHICVLEQESVSGGGGFTLGMEEGEGAR